MKASMRKAMGLAMAVLMVLALAAGCSSQGDDVKSASASATQTQGEAMNPAELNELMGRLATATTVEQANELIGSEGTLKENGSVSGESSSRPTKYVWDLGGGTQITGNYWAYEGRDDSVTYETRYDEEQVTDRADFSAWEDIKKRVGSDEGLKYDDLVEMLGGVPGLKTRTRTDGKVDYCWYDADGGYMNTTVDTDGYCGTTGGYF